MIEDIRASGVQLRAFAAMGLCFGAFAAYAPALKANAELSDGGFGLALLVASVGAVAAMMVAPSLDRRLGSWGQIVCALWLAGGGVLVGLSQGALAFTLSLFVAYAASGVMDVIMNARLSAAEAASGRSLMNLNHGVFSLLYAAGALGAGVLRQMGASPFLAFSCVGLVILGLCWGMRDTGKHEVGPVADKTSGRFPSATLTLAGGIVLIAFIAEQATENWSALHLERRFGANAAEGALGPALLGLTMGIGRLGGHGLVRHLSEARLIQLAAATAALGLLLAAYAPLRGLSYAGFAVLGLGVSVIGPTVLAWIGKAVPAAQRSAAVSRMVIIGYCGFFVGPPLMGGLSEIVGLPTALALLGLTLLAVSVVMVPLLRVVARRQVGLASARPTAARGHMVPTRPNGQ